MDRTSTTAYVAEVVRDDWLPTAGAASSIGPFTTFDPHLVLLSFLIGYLLLYVSLVVFDSIAAYLQADIPRNEKEGSVDSERVDVPRGRE